jgi:Tol biopolymer transport system component/serine/threonine protein kinase
LSLPPGTRLGAYTIVAPLGAGGMGQVYRARDPRLDRDVAIKVLSAQLAADPAALARFEREAMSVAKLSHPNILSIFEFVQDGGTAFVVTELVEGETLRARLEGGALPARRAVAYALQIARGMAAAHTRGIVHRDLKPENVMIARDDHVKILDFGLAKSIEPSHTEQTRVVSVATTAGTVLGTFGYMAPEQVRALDVDHRADMFAFGAVLYEMLSGERAFRGETAADTMTAILTKDPPDLDVIRLSISPSLDRIVRRCLEKSPSMRFQSANDLAFALETLSTPSTASSEEVRLPPSTQVGSGAPGKPDATGDRPGTARATPDTTHAVASGTARTGGKWLPWTIAALAVVVAAASWLLKGPAQKPEPRWDTFTRITESAGEETSPTLSPDGNTVAYAVRINGSRDIYAQRVGGRNATPIVNDPQRDEGAPAFSPDGSLIAFHVSGELGGIFVVGATGESVRRVTDVGFDPAWSPDGKQIAFTTEEVRDPSSRLGDSTLYIVDAAGGTPRKVIDSDAVQPAWSPSGQRIAYWSNNGGQRDIYTVPIAGGGPVQVMNDAAIDWSPTWSPDGKFIYYASDRGGAMNVWRIAVDQSSGRPVGAPEPVTAGVQAAAGIPRLSKDGLRLAFRSRVASINPVAIPFDPVTLRAGAPVTLDTQNNFRIPSDVSTDGKYVAFYSIGERQEDLFIGASNGPMRRVTDDPARDRAPVFTPDGRSLLFYSNRDGIWAPWIVGVDGGGLRKATNAPRGAVYSFVSPKGDQIVFAADSARAVYSAPLAATLTQSTELPGTSVGNSFFNPTGWSPDGARIAGILASPSGRTAGVAVYDLATHTTTVILEDETYAVKWLADSRRIVYFTKNGLELVVADTVTRKRTVVDVRLPGPSPNEMFAIAPDNRTIYYGAARAESDIWIVERK